MKRDTRGRYVKDEDNGYRFSFTVPSIKALIIWIFLAIILLPWAVIISKCDILKKIMETFENLIRTGEKEEGETPKKMVYFINVSLISIY